MARKYRWAAGKRLIGGSASPVWMFAVVAALNGGCDCVTAGGITEGATTIMSFGAGLIAGELEFEFNGDVLQTLTGGGTIIAAGAIVGMSNVDLTFDSFEGTAVILRGTTLITHVESGTNCTFTKMSFFDGFSKSLSFTESTNPGCENLRFTVLVTDDVGAF